MFHTQLSHNSYFLGCAHLQHKNLTRGESTWPPGNITRDFDTTIQMTQAVMDSLQIIKENDTLFILGDMMFGHKDKFQYYIDNIPTKKLVYLYGNHCVWLRNKPHLHSNFLWIGDYLEMFYNKTLVCMFHYPIFIWNESHHGAFQICSHSHGSFKPSRPETKTNGKILDVGWDVFHKPIHIDEIAQIMSLKQNIPLDHHNAETN